MLFSKQLPLPALIELCRSLRHNLGAGLSLVRVFQQLSGRGPAAVRPVAQRIHLDLERGESLQEALKPEKAYFPPLFLALAGVGEQTGHLPEIFGELEKYFLLQQKLWRQFVGQIIWPALQFFAAIFVIAGLIFILGIIGQMTGSAPLAPIGFGLTGTRGALLFLVIVFGFLGALAGLYLLATRSLKQKKAVDEWLLRVPALGPCLRALAMMRFCLALHLTMETGMPITKALRLSLLGAGNAAFAAHADAVADRLRGGMNLTSALAPTGLFTRSFRDILANAEETGQVPEVMNHQAMFFEEEAERRLRILTRAAGYIVWLFVAILIIVAIFRIFNNIILQQYEGAALGPNVGFLTLARK
ncbi:MAG: type II secretion system F family protein [Planctomycetes bacterium]|nr:type II secretion system F family protein [Planctomycetota bacterium]